MKIAVPVENGVLCSHFGHAARFASVDIEDGRIGESRLLVPPPHEPGSLPRWLKELGTTHVICGGIGARAVELLQAAGIEVVSGVSSMDPALAIGEFLAGRLQGVGGPTCQGHGHGEGGHTCGGH
ncbi:MAG TPA: dinitrogenase iron-molybdenum cofactor [Thermodesulfobacteriaceae bacterium]|nr:dinitrogenase iron-molybdenum cofactor [Thermodesulfobacteriaceae bacterium]